MYELHDYLAGEQSRIEEIHQPRYTHHAITQSPRRRRHTRHGVQLTPLDRLTESASLGGLGSLILVCLLMGARVDPGLGWDVLIVIAGAALGFFGALASLAIAARRRRLERQVLARPLASHRCTRSRTR
jgi:hypothetical protein